MLDHSPEDSACEIEGAFEIGLKHDIPIIARHAHGERVAGYASVVHQNVATAEVGEDLVARLLHGFKVGDIHRVGLGFTGCGGVDGIRRACGVRLRATDDGNFCAFGGESFCDGFADAASCSGDDGNLVFKSFCAHAERHRRPLTRGNGNKIFYLPVTVHESGWVRFLMTVMR